MKQKSLADFASRPSLKHLKRLTTREGVIQHADHEVPDPAFGYSIDDNARALIACLWHHQLFGDEAILPLAEIYFNYIKKAQNEIGGFHNFLSYLERFLDAEGSEDSIARAVWALGWLASSSPDSEIGKEALEIIRSTNLEKHHNHHYLRTKAYILLGLSRLPEFKNLALAWGEELVNSFRQNCQDDWQWFEDGLFYANGILPYALSEAGTVLDQPEWIKVAEKSFNWLNKVSEDQGLPAPIGQGGWYKKGQQRNLYDQQPLEAADMVLAATSLYQATKKSEYLELATTWMNWYFGLNSQKVTVVNDETSGIYDAVTPHGVNLNQGAESIVTFLLAYLALSKLALATNA